MSAVMQWFERREARRMIIAGRWTIDYFNILTLFYSRRFQTPKTSTSHFN
jgi:hypothetical protein